MRFCVDAPIVDTAALTEPWQRRQQWSLFFAIELGHDKTYLCLVVEDGIWILVFFLHRHGFKALLKVLNVCHDVCCQ